MLLLANEKSFGLVPDSLLEISAVLAMRNKLKMIRPVRLKRKEFTASVSLFFFNLAINHSTEKKSGRIICTV